MWIKIENGDIYNVDQVSHFAQWKSEDGQAGVNAVLQDGSVKLSVVTFTDEPGKPPAEHRAGQIMAAIQSSIKKNNAWIEADLPYVPSLPEVSGVRRNPGRGYV